MIFKVNFILQIGESIHKYIKHVCMQHCVHTPCSLKKHLVAECDTAWPAGRRDSDGVWAPAWYDAVEASTGFGPPRAEAGSGDLNDDLRRIADAARPH